MSSFKALQLRPGRRWKIALGISPAIMLSLVTILLSLCTTTQAQVMEVDIRKHDSISFRDMAARGEIHIDARAPQLRPKVHLQQRQAEDSDVPSTLSGPTSTSVSASKSASTSSVESTPAVTVVTSPLPSPFDTSIGSNFTNLACPRFFNNFLNNATFQSCIPVSLLIQNSNSFFRALRSPALLSQTLDAACKAPLAMCSPLLLDVASQLIENSNCGQDYKQQNPLVCQAYAGLVAYEPIYRATCLRDATTDNYCFAEAISNSSNPADSFPYYTALGLTMPASEHPTCKPCLKETMSIFAGYAENAIQPLAKTYLPCASQIDATCGAEFARTDVKVGSVGEPNAAVVEVSVPRTSLILAATVALVWIGLC